MENLGFRSFGSGRVCALLQWCRLVSSSGASTRSLARALPASVRANPPVESFSSATKSETLKATAERMKGKRRGEERRGEAGRGARESGGEERESEARRKDGARIIKPLDRPKPCLPTRSLAHSLDHTTAKDSQNSSRHRLARLHQHHQIF